MSAGLQVRQGRLLTHLKESEHSSAVLHAPHPPTHTSAAGAGAVPQEAPHVLGTLEESSYFFENMVFPQLSMPQKTDMGMLRTLMKERIMGKYNIPEDDAAEESERLFKECFHELYRRVPLFMLAMDQMGHVLQQWVDHSPQLKRTWWIP